METTITVTNTINPHNTAELLRFQDDDLLFYEEFKTISYGDALKLAEDELADEQAVVVNMYEAGGLVFFSYVMDEGTAVLTLNPGFGAQLSIYSNHQDRAIEFFWHK